MNNEIHAGSAGSIFGFCYYCMIAFCTFAMSILHNGTVLPLPLYIISLGIILLIGCRMIELKSLRIESTG